MQRPQRGERDTARSYLDIPNRRDDCRASVALESEGRLGDSPFFIRRPHLEECAFPPFAQLLPEWPRWGLHLYLCEVRDG
jgi:hypothetical protein